MRAFPWFAAAFALVTLGVLGSNARAQQPASAQKPGLRVGTFDSRALVMAYAGSKEFNDKIKAMMDEHTKAKQAGDQKTVQKLEAEGKAQQQRFHEQGFAATPADDILERIKDSLPQIAKEAGVDVIVSKWQIAYRAPNAEMVDVTDLIVKPFNPSAKTLRNIEEIKKVKPLPREEVLKHKD